MKLGSLNIPGPHALIAGFSTLTVVLLALVDVGRTSPGDLARAHARVPDLEGRAGCSMCHGGWGTSMTEACLDCHDAVAADMDAGVGLHGVLAGDASACASCHSDHHGMSFPLVNAQSFRQAGFEERDEFDHGVLGFHMEGSHLELDCAACHEFVDEPTLPEGVQRFGGLGTECAACHDDAHDGEMRAACTACHGQVTFDALASDVHDFLPLVGEHGAAACTDCHDAGTVHSLDALGRRPGRDPRGCVDCHADPHDAMFLERVERADVIGTNAGCALCHDSVHASFTPPSAHPTRDFHALSGFALTAPHDQASCEDCHAAEGDFEARYPGRGADDCAACHADPHDGQFETGPFGGQGCLACHDRHAFEPHAFGLEEHADLALPLDGAHGKIECRDCHDKRPDRPRSFSGTPAECASCHEDAHRGFFGEDNSRCADCHVATTFADPGPEPFDHAERAGFAILGAHAQSDCETCHRPRQQPDPSGRVFGWIPDHFGEYEGCVSCHEDPHGGRFDQRGRPADVEGRKDCARCHDQSSFRAFPGGFDHELWTGFALTGVHGRIDCGDCHAPTPFGAQRGRTLGAVEGTDCADCHADPHAGQFLDEGRTDCLACHKSTRTFAALFFDHDDSRFPLDEAHGRVRCNECHKPWRISAEREVIRYKPLETDCASCHGTHAGPSSTRGGAR